MHARPRTDKTCISPIRLVDVTLVSFSQGVCIPFDAKVAKALELATSGIDVLDMGEVLPVPGKLVLVEDIAQSVRGISLAACAQGDQEHIDTAWKALRCAEQPVLRVCIQISDWYRIEERHESEQELLQQVRTMLISARERCPTVEFIAKDATRCEEPLLCQLVEVAIEAGASAVTLLDLVGDDLPLHATTRFRTMMEQVAGIDAITLGVAAHNRYGYALENTLAAICAGARQVTVDESSGGHLTRADLQAALHKLARSEEGTITPP